MTEDPSRSREDQVATTEGDGQAESGQVAGPGERLRLQRESRNLTVAQAAQELRLSSRIVLALEGDQFEVLEAPIYVRGHLKNYARLLELPEVEIVRAYDQTLPDEVVFEPKTRGKEGPVLNNGTPRWIFPVAWLVVLLMLVMGGLWWYAGPHREPVASLESESDREAPDDGESRADANGSESEGAMGRTVALPPLDASVELDIPEGLEAASASEPGNSDVSPASGLADEVAQVADEVLPAVPEPEGQAAADGPESDLFLQVSLESDSWLEVSDSSGRQLFQGLAREGRQLELSGVGPIELFMGNAPAVQIEVEGQRLDFSDRVRGDNTARVVVPPE